MRRARASCCSSFFSKGVQLPSAQRGQTSFMHIRQKPPQSDAGAFGFTNTTVLQCEQVNVSHSSRGLSGSSVTA